ncbi:MAG TPA: OmpA family protein [Syntrophales bacterium]|nr:OmpA family protein [Syntrophales bacterium]
MQPVQHKEEGIGERNPSDVMSEGNWLVTYCSLIITLVSVFMMLVSYSNQAGGKLKKYRQSLGMTTAAAVVPFRTVDIVEPSLESMRKAVDENGYSGRVKFIRSKHGFKAIMESGIFFQPGSAVLKEESRPFLEDVGKIIRRRCFSLGLGGHLSSSASPSAEFPSGWELSIARATRIMRYFQEREKIPAGRLAAAGFGQYRPIAAETTPEESARNDRIEFLFVREGLEADESAPVQVQQTAGSKTDQTAGTASLQ